MQQDTSTIQCSDPVSTLSPEAFTDLHWCHLCDRQTLSGRVQECVAAEKWDGNLQNCTAGQPWTLEDLTGGWVKACESGLGNSGTGADFCSYLHMQTHGLSFRCSWFTAIWMWRCSYNNTKKNLWLLQIGFVDKEKEIRRGRLQDQYSGICHIHAKTFALSVPSFSGLHMLHSTWWRRALQASRVSASDGVCECGLWDSNTACLQQQMGNF